MKFDVFGTIVKVVDREGSWKVFYIGNEGKKRLAGDIVIPSSVSESELAEYLADIRHEYASHMAHTPRGNIMKVFNIVIVAVIALLSIAAGAAKVMQVPEELEFLQSMGFSVPLIVAFGSAQIVAGVLLVFPKTRIPGCAIAIVAFSLSTVMIFISGDARFGAFSTLSILLAIVVLALARNPGSDTAVQATTEDSAE
jgi:hypothetical protein